MLEILLSKIYCGITISVDYDDARAIVAGRIIVCYATSKYLLKYITPPTLTHY